MIKFIEKYPIATIIVIVLIMLLPNLSSLQVSIMEARNFIVAREMLLDGNWILTTMNGEARYEKPPLPTWLAALSVSMFDIKNVFGYRLPSVLTVCVTGIFTYLLSKRLLENKQQSFYNGLIVVTSFYVLGIVFAAPWDIYAHAFTLIAIYYLFEGLSVKFSLKIIILTSIFLGCSILSKGPVSLYALFLPFLISYTIVYKLDGKALLKIALVLFLAIIIGGWWFLYARISDPETFLKMATIETSRWSSYHVRPFYYYFSFFIQSGLWTIPAFTSLLFPYLKNKVSNNKVYKLSFYWTIIGVVLLSIIPEKKTRYLMPVLIPLAINIGFYINYIITNFKSLKNKKELFPVYFHFGTISAIGILFPIIGFLLFKERLNEMMLSYVIVSISLLSIGLVMVVYLYKKHLKRVFYLSILLFVVLCLVVVPKFNTLVLINTSDNDISKLKQELDNTNMEAYLLDYMSPEMMWHYGHKITRISNLSGKIDLVEASEFGILTTSQTLEDLKSDYQAFNIIKKATYDLNLTGLGSKRYGDRLVNHYYIFKRKQ